MDRRRKKLSSATMSIFLDSIGGSIDNVDVATFDDDGNYLKALVVGIDLTQSGTGDPSPDNIRPISGHASVNVIVSPTLNPLDGTITNIPLGTTVYGGTLDVLTGVLTVDKVAITIDGNNIVFNQIASYGALNRFGLAYPSGLAAKYTGSSTYCIADKLTPSYNNTIAINQDRPEGYFCFPHSVAFFVSLPSSTITTIAEANAWAADNTPKVVYLLATPQVIRLTGHQIATLLGTNNVWCDSGKIIHLEY